MSDAPPEKLKPLYEPHALKAGRQVNQKIVDKTGFEPEDLLEAPLKPPELKNTRRYISNTQLLLILIGFIIALIGLVVWAASASVWAVVLIVAGAITIATATLIRL